MFAADKKGWQTTAKYGKNVEDAQFMTLHKH